MIYNYPKFKIRLAPDSKQRQGLQVGDVVRRQYLDGNTSRYSLMAVLETGTEEVEGTDGTQQPSPYFIGALLEGDEPRNGELLDFMRVTSLTDLSRSGALYLSASDEEAPFLDVIDGMGSERSLCRPSGNQNICRDSEYLDCSYTPADGQASRIYTLRRNAVPPGADAFGVLLPLPATLDHPQRIVVSFRSKSSKTLDEIPLTVGYTDGTDTDGSVPFSAGAQWNFHLFTIAIDYPPTVERALSIDLSGHLTAAGDTFCIADLNVVRLSDLSDYPAASKVRVGKITGIADPLFGVLDGYGAYFQNLYATRNVNVAGTLTAGDRKGFASTFYVGRIHTNCLINSLEGNFRTAVTPLPEEPAPTGIGVVSLLEQPSTELECQSEAWTQAHKGERYCFSFWAMSAAGDAELQLSYNDAVLGVFLLDKEWRRFHAAFDVAHLPGGGLCMAFSGAGAALAGYQLEAGERPSLYQPTDEVLDETEDYGAWFNKGGIGGTIQNPLLKLGDDGSIRSANGSFVINADGTGYFAGGKFKWDEQHIELSGIDLDWKEIAQHVPGLDWIEEWNTGKTHIGAELVVTPKIFAGVKHDDGLLTGVALGRFPVKMYNDDLTEIVTGTIEGIAGFDHGRKVFSAESSGNVALGFGDESIRYNAATGKIEFGSAVSLQWAGATYIDQDGIFTGTLSADTVNAIGLNASQLVAGTIDAARIDTETLKTLLLTAENIEALTLHVKQGTIGGWIIDDSSIYRGTKKDAQSAFTDNLNDITIGQTGIRGRKWRLDADGTGAIAGGNIWWDMVGNVIFAPSVSLSWQSGIDAASELAHSANTILSEHPLTYIGATGIYTGTLNAGQVTTGFLSAERLEAGSIKAEKLDAASIRADLINTDYINGLNCTFDKGTIGGWSIGAAVLSADHILLDSGDKRIVVYGINPDFATGNVVQLYHNNDSDFGLLATDENGTCLVRLGAVNQIAGWNIYPSRIYKNNVTLGADGSITNWMKWSLNCDGSGQIASGNISWDADGAVTFSPSVSLVWKEPIGDITAALGGGSFSKLTQLTATGIYTGTLTAIQVNAVDIDAGSIRTGTLSADRIAAGSIKAEKLDTQSIKTDIVNTDYINGLECTFVQGKIGGWTIAGDSLSAGYLGAMYETPIQLRPASSGSGEWYLGQYKPLGMTVTWHQMGNAGHIVFGQVAASGSSEKTGFIGLQMMSWVGEEYFCLSADTTYQGGRSIYNRIAGWAFDHQQIWKNGVSLGADGSIRNDTKWQLNNDGSGQVASGNIVWDVAGNVTFSPSVILQWGSSESKIGQIYARGTGLNNNAPRLVRVNGADVDVGYGRGLTLVVLNRTDLSVTSISLYDVYLNDDVRASLAAALNALGSDKIVILTSCDAICINETLRIAIERCGGSDWTGYGRYPYALIGIPGIGKNNGLNAIWDITATDPYAELSTTVINGIPQGVDSGGRKMTHINDSGVYTGFVSAGQVRVDTALVVGGSSYDGSISVRDAANNGIVTLNRAGITAIGGTIGGWALNASQIYSGPVVLSSGGSITNSNRWGFQPDGSGYLAGGKFTWDSAGNISAVGGNFKDVTIQGTIRSAFVLNDSSIWIGGSDASQMDPRHYDNVVVVRGSWDQNINLQWTLNQSGRRICMVNYMWRGVASTGYMAVGAPSGKYFYEDGIAKSTLSFSREMIELLGYGDDQTFYGWIVINRRDVMCTNYYGYYPQVLAQGTVTCTSATRGAVMKYKSFDGKALTVSHSSQGFFTVNIPWWIPADNYMVLVTGKTSPVQNTSIYATVRSQYSNYFTVTTQDDASVNDGSFNFQIISMADFTTYSQP